MGDMMRMPAVLAMLMMMGPMTPALSAQSVDFSGVNLEGLPTIFVTEASGAETRGKLLSLTESALAVDVEGTTRTFTPAEIVKIERRGDSLKNGAIIGAAFGLLGGLVSDCPSAQGRREGCAGTRVGLSLAGAAIWAGVGAGIDALIPGRTRLWQAPSR